VSGPTSDPVEGGAVAASVVALSAELVKEIAARATGWEEAGGAVAQAVRLAKRSAALSEENRRAHRAAVEALSARGDPRLGMRLERAAALPLAIVQTAADVAELAAYVADRTEPDVRADAVVAASLAAGAAAGGAQLVRVNLGVGARDARLQAAESALARARDAATTAAARSD
jgi:methenyltetrahydrofolate cyclohydrolase